MRTRIRVIVEEFHEPSDSGSGYAQWYTVAGTVIDDDLTKAESIDRYTVIANAARSGLKAWELEEEAQEAQREANRQAAIREVQGRNP